MRPILSIFCLNGFGLSTALVSSATRANETVTPRLTSFAARRRVLGVIRFNRPQFITVAPAVPVREFLQLPFDIGQRHRMPGGPSVCRRLRELLTVMRPIAIPVRSSIRALSERDESWWWNPWERRGEGWQTTESTESGQTTLTVAKPPGQSSATRLAIPMMPEGLRA